MSLLGNGKFRVDCKSHHFQKFTACCGILYKQLELEGSFHKFFTRTCVMSFTRERLNVFVQLDGCSVNKARSVCQCLKEHFSNQWIGRGVPLRDWLPRSHRFWFHSLWISHAEGFLPLCTNESTATTEYNHKHSEELEVISLRQICTSMADRTFFKPIWGYLTQKIYNTSQKKVSSHILLNKYRFSFHNQVFEYCTRRK